MAAPEPNATDWTTDYVFSVEYRAGGPISAMEIAPAEYRGFNPLNPPEVLSEIANAILEVLLPGITVHGDVRETIIKSIYPGFLREVRSLPGALLTRDFPLGGDRSKMIAAVMEVSGADLERSASEVISPLGAPECEQFAAGSGLAVCVFQNSNPQIVISAEESLSAQNDHARPISLDGAEKLLLELLPAAATTNSFQRSVFRSGAFSSERFLFPQFLLCRNYVNADIVGISVSWR